ncbi:MAG: hypothetical protein M3Q99_14640 [Acidobacteriota bacterium]|nr:hypothetical protein [Acidobacteriota bacterium]
MPLRALKPTIEVILRERKRLTLSAISFFCCTENSVTDCHKILCEAAESVGVAYDAKTRGDFIIRDVRHTAVTRMLQAGIDLSIVNAINGTLTAN